MSSNKCMCMFIGGSNAACTSGFPSSLSSEEEPMLRQMIDVSIARGFYLFPDLQFLCKTDIIRVQGYFLINPSESTSLYLQIWRKQNLTRDYIRLNQVNLNFSAQCNNNEQCYIDHLLPHEIEVESEDFIGFYTNNNTLARPLFSSATSTTQLYLVSSRTDVDIIMLEENFKNLSIRYRPQVMSKLEVIFHLCLRISFISDIRI